LTDLAIFVILPVVSKIKGIKMKNSKLVLQGVKPGLYTYIDNEYDSNDTLSDELDLLLETQLFSNFWTEDNNAHKVVAELNKVYENGESDHYKLIEYNNRYYYFESVNVSEFSSCEVNVDIEDVINDIKSYMAVEDHELPLDMKEKNDEFDSFLRSINKHLGIHID
jgi:hypothetical protein